MSIASAKSDMAVLRQEAIVTPFGAISDAFTARILERFRVGAGLYQLYSLEYLYDDAGEPFAAGPVYNIDFALTLEGGKSTPANMTVITNERALRVVERVMRGGRMVQAPAAPQGKPGLNTVQEIPAAQAKAVSHPKENIARPGQRPVHGAQAVLRIQNEYNIFQLQIAKMLPTRMDQIQKEWQSKQNARAVAMNVAKIQQAVASTARSNRHAPPATWEGRTLQAISAFREQRGMLFFETLTRNRALGISAADTYVSAEAPDMALTEKEGAQKQHDQAESTQRSLIGRDNARSVATNIPAYSETPSMALAKEQDQESQTAFKGAQEAERPARKNGVLHRLLRLLGGQPGGNKVQAEFSNVLRPQSVQKEEAGSSREAAMPVTTATHAYMPGQMEHRLADADVRMDLAEKTAPAQQTKAAGSAKERAQSTIAMQGEEAVPAHAHGGIGREENALYRTVNPTRSDGQLETAGKHVPEHAGHIEGNPYAPLQVAQLEHPDQNRPQAAIKAHEAVLHNNQAGQAKLRQNVPAEASSSQEAIKREFAGAGRARKASVDARTVIPTTRAMDSGHVDADVREPLLEAHVKEGSAIGGMGKPIAHQNIPSMDELFYASVQDAHALEATANREEAYAAAYDASAKNKRAERAASHDILQQADRSLKRIAAVDAAHSMAHIAGLSPVAGRMLRQTGVLPIEGASSTAKFGAQMRAGVAFAARLQSPASVQPASSLHAAASSQLSAGTQSAENLQQRAKAHDYALPVPGAIRGARSLPIIPMPHIAGALAFRSAPPDTGHAQRAARSAPRRTPPDEWTYAPQERSAHLSAEPAQFSQPSAVTSYAESAYVKSLPGWTQDFLRESFVHPEQALSSSRAERAQSVPYGAVSMQASTLKTPSSRKTPQASGAARQTVWTAPGYAGPPAKMAHKESEKQKRPAQAPVRLSDAEINRMAGKVYTIIEERIARERRRLGF